MKAKIPGWFAPSKLRRFFCRCWACRTCPACRRWRNRPDPNCRPSRDRANQAWAESVQRIRGWPKISGGTWNDQLLEGRWCRRRVGQFLRAFGIVVSSNRVRPRGIGQICRSLFRLLKKCQPQIIFPYTIGFHLSSLITKLISNVYFLKLSMR